ncbi:ThiF family adenylyltransferase [Methanobacterium alcaliphilum]|uniref:ThiF family adenylyltransferase n=1 Tax=Methanobacterium alcaliphilum TaxID=392018 RepID=UPI00200A3DDD|nr:ThiF family adenylyltransferase [Methanobacterium alcaliphilum]MCK9150484.1 ThiF family adenylyltransferase [Methanobacterium alcaliphilum]
MENKKFCENLKKGRRALDGEKGITILNDWKYDSNLKKWFIKIKITSNSEGVIPDDSNWYVVVDEDYPNGVVKIFPDALSGFKDTLQHQSNNGELECNELWRKGSLCLESHVHGLGRYDFNPEPLDSDERLLWNVKRAIEWIILANENKLISNGDNFEFPQFNLISDSTHLTFSEDITSYKVWQKIGDSFGFLKLNAYKTDPFIYFIKEFQTPTFETINEVRWGKYLSQDFDIEKTIIWIMLKETPVLNTWQAPNTLGELIDVCEDQGIDIITIINHFSHFIRNEAPHFISLGFPIPKIIGGTNSIVHWQAVKLPSLSNGSIKGFRSHENSYQLIDKIKLNRDKKITWLKSQNWNMEEINARGKFIHELSSMKTLIIGCGAIGSSIAELLVRAGVNNITVMDNDKLEIGNLSRHILGLNQIGNFKSKETANNLNETNPHANVKYSENFKFSKDCIDKIEKYNLIVDCTGEDMVLNELEKYEFSEEKIFVSISIGFAAGRLYLFLQKSIQCKSNCFFEAINPWLKKEFKDFSDHDLPRDGTGCWSPTFPARYDDILLAASTSVKVIENFIINKKTELVSIYEQYFDDHIFVGYKNVSDSNELD